MTDMVLVPRGALNAMLGYIEVASHAIELGHVGAKCFGDLKAALSAAPPAVGREEIARAAALAILAQDGMESDCLNDDLTLNYLDQGETDFGKVADAILSALGRTEALTPPEGEG